MKAPKRKAARMLAHPTAAPKHNSLSTERITGTLPATTCTACREPAGPMHGATVWRLCVNCRAMTGSAATLPLILARIAATLDMQRQTARRTAR